ncbi:MAG: hypothetical protein AB1589_14240 [Cyanobacteriota bacterium]
MRFPFDESAIASFNHYIRSLEEAIAFFQLLTIASINYILLVLRSCTNPLNRPEFKLRANSKSPLKVD